MPRKKKKRDQGKKNFECKVGAQESGYVGKQFAGSEAIIEPCLGLFTACIPPRWLVMKLSSGKNVARIHPKATISQARVRTLLASLPRRGRFAPVPGGGDCVKLARRYGVTS